MASLDSAKGPSATVRPFPETIFPSRSSGWALLTFPSKVRRSNQLFHWPMIFWISSVDRPLSHCAPRNNSRYSDVVVCVLISYCLSSDRFASVQIQDEQAAPFRTLCSNFFEAMPSICALGLLAKVLCSMVLKLAC